MFRRARTKSDSSEQSDNTSPKVAKQKTWLTRSKWKKIQKLILLLFIELSMMFYSQFVHEEREVAPRLYRIHDVRIQTQLICSQNGTGFKNWRTSIKEVKVSSPDDSELKIKNIKNIPQFVEKAVSKFRKGEQHCLAINLFKIFKRNSYPLELIDKDRFGARLALKIVFDNSLAHNSQVRLHNVEDYGYQLLERGDRIIMGQSLDYENDIFIQEYEENCRDYRGEGLFTQNNCYDQCCKSYAIKNSVPLPKSVLVFEFEEQKFKNLRVGDDNAMSDYCHSQCAVRSCHEEHPLFHSFKNAHEKYPDKQFFELKVYFPRSKPMINLYERKSFFGHLLLMFPFQLIVVSITILVLLRTLEYL